MDWWDDGRVKGSKAELMNIIFLLAHELLTKIDFEQNLNLYTLD